MNDRLAEVCEGRDLEDVLVEQGKRFKRLKHVAEALQISYQLLIYWISKLGVSKEDFYRKKVCRKPCKLVHVNGDFRYKFVKAVDKKCKCFVGFKDIVVSIQTEELYSLAQENGFEITETEKDRNFSVKKKER